MASKRGQNIISYAYTFNKNGTGRQSCYHLHLSEKNKHNRTWQNFQHQLMRPMHCSVWEMYILSLKVLSKILTSVVNTVLSPIKGSLSNPRGSQCDLLDNTVAWNCTDLLLIPALLLVDWDDLEYSLRKAFIPPMQNGDPDSYFIFKELEHLLVKMS